MPCSALLFACQSVKVFHCWHCLMSYCGTFLLERMSEIVLCLLATSSFLASLEAAFLRGHDP